jgi:hypothetical protein
LILRRFDKNLSTRFNFSRAGLHGVKSIMVVGGFVADLLFFYLVCEAIGTAASPGLLCQPRVIMKMIVEKQMGCRLAGETEVLGENLLQRHFRPSQNPT